MVVSLRITIDWNPLSAWEKQRSNRFVDHCEHFSYIIQSRSLSRWNIPSPQDIDDEDVDSFLFSDFDTSSSRQSLLNSVCHLFARHVYSSLFLRTIKNAFTYHTYCQMRRRNLHRLPRSFSTISIAEKTNRTTTDVFSLSNREEYLTATTSTWVSSRCVAVSSSLSARTDRSRRIQT